MKKKNRALFVKNSVSEINKPDLGHRSIKIYNHDCYREYVGDLIKTFPKRGRGQYFRISQFLGISTTMTSQIFKGSKDLSLDQAYKLCQFFSLGPLETDYFILLVQREKAHTEELRKYYSQKLTEARSRFYEIKNLLPSSSPLKDEDKAFFYSHYLYSAVRMATSLQGSHTLDSLAQMFNLDKKNLTPILRFLTKTGLCKNDNGLISMGPARTHIEASSPLAARHHSNWLLKAMEEYLNFTGEDLAFTAPMSLSLEDFSKIRAILCDLIKDIGKIVEHSPAERVACLNIDFFGVVKSGK